MNPIRRHDTTQSSTAAVEPTSQPISETVAIARVAREPSAAAPTAYAKRRELDYGLYDNIACTD